MYDEKILLSQNKAHALDLCQSFKLFFTFIAKCSIFRPYPDTSLKIGLSNIGHKAFYGFLMDVLWILAEYLF